jgi:DNA-binding SARP family transcriptional activator/tetratricopeptide (TPR) repeat protein
MRWQLLGPVTATADGRTAHLPRPQQRAVLAYLLLNANQVVSIDRLVDAVWEAPPATARAQVHACVSQLRRALSAIAAEQVLTSEPGGYRIAVATGELDQDVFVTHLQDARAAAEKGDQATAADLLRAGLALWHGAPLTGAAGAFVADAVTGLQEWRLAAHEELAEAELSLGRHADAVASLRPLVETHPLRERLVAHLMLALAGSGQQTEALQVYTRTRSRLAGELGVDPGPHLADAQLRILRQQVPTGCDGAPAQPAPARVPAQLPPDTVAFTGRSDHLRQLDTFGAPRAARSPRTGVICGTAGVGKTALAVHWAHQVADQFPDGQLYVNLHGYSTGPAVPPIEAIGMFLRSLGIGADRIPIDLAEASALYRSTLAGRRMLVLLDNARSADQVRPLLPGSGDCLALITSRDRLGGLVARDGAHRLTLDVLSPQEAHALLTQILGAHRVHSEPHAATELAGICGYLPLALRIAAANLIHRPHRSIAQHVTELRDGNRLAALAVDGDEHAAVRVALDLSYKSVPADARRLFRLLGLVPGTDITTDAVASLIGTTPAATAPLLDRLAAAHLITEHAPDRFTFHDLLRHHARERAEADGAAEAAGGEPAAATRRLLIWYLNTVENATQLLFNWIVRRSLPPSDQPGLAFAGPAEAQAWVAAERHNLVAAVDYAATHGPPEVSWLLADRLRAHLSRSGHLGDQLATAQRGLATAEAAADALGQGSMHLSIAQASFEFGHHATALDHLNKALTLFRDGGWREGEAAATTNRGVIYQVTGRLAEAIGEHTRAIELYRRGRAGTVAAGSLNNLGYTYYFLGRLAEAVEALTESITLYRDAGLILGEAVALDSLSAVEHSRGRFDEALEMSTRALAIQRKSGGRYQEALVLNHLAEIHTDLGHLDTALELAHASHRLSRDIGDRHTVTHAASTIASIHEALGHPPEALRWYQQGLVAARDIKAPYPTVVALTGLASAYGRLGRYDGALDHGHRGLDIAERNGFGILEGRLLTTLARLLLDSGRLGESVEYARRALDNHRRTGHRPGEARTLAILGDASTDGVLYRQAAVDLFTELGAPAGTAGAAGGLAVT